MTVATAGSAAGAERVLHLQIEPGGDIALLNAIARWRRPALVRRPVIEERCERQTFEVYQRSTLNVDMPPPIFAEAAQITGARRADRTGCRVDCRAESEGRKRRTLLH
jgi:anaerobic selenocysteine-containing dehydrogenase